MHFAFVLYSFYIFIFSVFLFFIFFKKQTHTREGDGEASGGLGAMVPPGLSNFPLTGGLKVEIIFKLKNFDKIYMFFKFQSSNVSRKKNNNKNPKNKILI